MDLEPGPRVTMHCWATQECPAPAAPNCFILLTITVCALGSSGHSPPGLYNLMKLNVRRSVFSVPSLNLLSITSSSDHQGSCCWMARAGSEKRNAAKTPEAAAEARALRWRATLRSGRGDGNWFTICKFLSQQSFYLFVEDAYSQEAFITKHN